jgi:hypothetical protein
LAIAANTPIPVLGGWKLASQLTTKDYVFSWDGYPLPIKTIQHFTAIKMFDVQLKDGVYVQVDGHAKFPAFTMFNRQREARKKTNRPRQYIQRYYSPEDLLEKGLQDKRGWNMFSIENSAPLQYPTEDHPVPPFLAGLWAMKQRSKVRFTFDPNWVEPVQKKLRSLGWYTERKKNSLIFKQSINTAFLTRYPRIPITLPIEYTFGSIEQRIEFLRGIVAFKPTAYNPKLDTFFIYSRSTRFLITLQSICESLGMKTYVLENPGSLTNKLSFKTDIRLHPDQPQTKNRGSKRRMITNIQPIPVKPVVHIETDAPFVAGQGFLPIWH